MAAVDKTSALDAAPPAAKPRKLLVPILGAVVVSAGIAGGAVYFIAGKKAAPAEGGEAAAGAAHEGADAAKGEGHGDAKGGKKAATYFALTPSFVVNLSDADASRFLQVDMEVRAASDAAVEAVKLHMPQIRNSLLMLLGAQKLHDIDTREGKEALQKRVLEEIQRILTTETGSPGVEAVYFTSFVMQ